MEIIFMGTPEFAACSLEKINSSGYEIAAVFTQPDKPKNRGMKLEASPVKLLAQSMGIPVYQPKTLRDTQVENTIRDINPDLIVVVAYGKMLPENILNIPRLGCINVHASLLPQYRGAAPIQWSILNGDSKTGVTIMFMAPELDAGDIISQRETEIDPNETSGELFERLKTIGAELLTDTMPDIEAGKSTRTKQDDALVTFAPPLDKDMSPIDWSRTAIEIKNHVRGLSTWPVATAQLDGRSFKIYEAQAVQGNTGAQPGRIISADEDGIHVACGDGAVLIKQLQAAGKKRMSASDYLRGNPFG